MIIDWTLNCLTAVATILRLIIKYIHVTKCFIKMARNTFVLKPMGEHLNKVDDILPSLHFNSTSIDVKLLSYKTNLKMQIKMKYFQEIRVKIISYAIQSALLCYVLFFINIRSVNGKYIVMRDILLARRGHLQELSISWAVDLSAQR